MWLHVAQHNLVAAGGVRTPGEAAWVLRVWGRGRGHAGRAAAAPSQHVCLRLEREQGSKALAMKRSTALPPWPYLHGDCRC